MRLFRDNELEGLVAKVPGAAIRCVAVDPAGKRIAISSECALRHLIVFACFNSHVVNWS